MTPRDRLRRAAPALLGLALLCLFFAATLDPAVQLYYRDTGRLYYPVKLFIAQQLRAGHLPLWDPLTECGVSLLGQVTPALLHPATLLYLAFPFDLAFKLNHMLGPLLGGIGAYRLSRRIGASTWASMAGAIAYAGCGYVISVTGSNLPYAIGVGSVPIAVDAVLGFVEAPSVGRYAWAGAAVALIAYAGEPQSVLIAGLLSAAWVLAIAKSVRGAARNIGLAACCGALALALSAPAVAPAVVELRRSDRLQAPDEKLRAAFLNHPARLLGLLIPRAFDDAPEALEHNTGVSSTYSEFFTTNNSAFADSIVFGAPGLLLAAVACGMRRGRVLVAGAILFALASTGVALGIDRLLFGALPAANAFRFAEKLTGPACLLLALAASLGAEIAFAGTGRAAFRTGVAAILLAVVSGSIAAVIAMRAPQLVGSVAALGKTHRPLFAEALLHDLRLGLQDIALLSAALGAAALFRSVRNRPAVALAPLCCAASVFASSGGLLYTAPFELLQGPYDLARRLEEIAGPSPGRWRMFVNFQDPMRLSGVPPRVAVTASMAQALFPQFNSIANIEGMAKYFSASDLDYLSAIVNVPDVFFDLFGVRFAVEMPHSISSRFAVTHGFKRMGFGYWVREFPVASRAFVVGSAHRVRDRDAALDALTRPGFSVRRSAVLIGDGAPAEVLGVPSAALLERVDSDSLRVQANGPGLLVIGEHYDAGWRTTISGTPAPVFKADLAALGIVLPPGESTVELRFVPVGLRGGIAVAAGAVLALAAITLIQRRRRGMSVASTLA